MMRTHLSRSASLASRVGIAVSAVALLLSGLSCTENLPNGPNTFSVGIKILVPHDTIVIGDSSAAQAQATDGAGHVIQALSFAWTSADSSIVGFGTVPAGNADAESGRTRSLVAKKTGRSVVTLALPDPRFVVSNVTRTETAVVDGVKVLTSHDSTLTAINDTAVAIAAGLVHANAQPVPRVSTGIKWIHLGTHVGMVGAGDTIRFIARSNGPDTLIATNDFCLAGAKCADTVVARVSQQLTLALSARTFQAWSFGDSLGPAITLADRRGNGLAGTSVRFVPRTAADSLIVRATPPIGVTNPVNGSMAAPLLVSTGNGTARVAVLGIALDGSTVAVDSITETVRQVARWVNVEPIAAIETADDSIPVKAVARDARGAAIPDATIVLAAVGTPVHNLNGINWAGPTVLTNFTGGTITPTLSGVALPASNPLAPQIAFTTNPSVIALLGADSVLAGVTPLTVTTAVFDSLGRPAIGRLVRFDVVGGAIPDPVLVDGNGVATVVWTPPNIAGRYTLTGVFGASTQIFSVADSTGHIVIRRSVTVYADVPSDTVSTVVVDKTSVAATTGTAMITITARDQFGNLAKGAKPADFLLTTGMNGGTISAFTCSSGLCTATYTAPAAAGTDSITVTLVLNGLQILNSPIVMTITP